MSRVDYLAHVELAKMLNEELLCHFIEEGIECNQILIQACLTDQNLNPFLSDLKEWKLAGIELDLSSFRLLSAMDWDYQKSVLEILLELHHG